MLRLIKYTWTDMSTGSSQECIIRCKFRESADKKFIKEIGSKTWKRLNSKTILEEFVTVVDLMTIYKKDKLQDIKPHYTVI